MWLSWLLGYAKVVFYGARNTITLSTKDGSERSLSDICKSITPTCRLNPFLFNGHLQTIWTAVKGQDVPVIYKRKIFEAEDPDFAGSFAVDFVAHGPSEIDKTLPPRTTYFSKHELENIGSLDSKPMLITLHGLSGGSHELYLRHVLAPLCSKEGGWEACVVISRGCARSKITSSILYNARATWDIRQVVKWCRKTFPNRPLFGIGYSLGANIMTNYLGEEGDKCLLKAAVVIANPWNLEIGSVALRSTWIRREVYSKTLGAAMKKMFSRHINQIRKNPKMNIERVMNIKYLYEFDRELQGPTWGYPTENAYYRDASSSDSLLAIRIPLFAIHAEDDPVASKWAVPYEEFQKNPFAFLCTTSSGGHLSWFELGGGRWYVKPTVAFLQTMARDVNSVESSKNLDNKIKETMPPGHADAGFRPMRRKLRYRYDLES